MTKKPEKIIKVCPLCGLEFKVAPCFSNRIYCSAQCQDYSRNPNKDNIAPRIPHKSRADEIHEKRKILIKAENLRLRQLGRKANGKRTKKETLNKVNRILEKEFGNIVMAGLVKCGKGKIKQIKR